jgi:hypothetical protein
MIQQSEGAYFHSGVVLVGAGAYHGPGTVLDSVYFCPGTVLDSPGILVQSWGLSQKVMHCLRRGGQLYFG